MNKKSVVAALGLAALLAGLVGEAPAALAATSTAPSAPAGLTAIPSNTAVSLSWTAPTDNGGSAVTGYNLYEGTKSGAENYTAPVNDKTLITRTDTIVTGLANAKTYYFTVKASNLMGSSPASLETFAIPAATVPTAPTHVAATVSDASTPVTWDAPSNPGGSNITGYTVTAFDSTVTSRGGERCEWTAGPLTCTISDVTNGDSYTFSVTATNSLGTSVASTVSNTVVPAVTVPLVPNSVTATPGNTAVVLSWIAPVTGGSVITGYNVYQGTKSGGENMSAPVNGTTLIANTTTAVTGLVNGHEYYFTVKAVNSIGSSGQSTEVWAIPAGATPGIPTDVTARSGYQSATVSWTAPSDSGGSAISRYTVTAADSTATSRGGQACTWSTGTLTCTLTGLTDGDSYTFAVTATNSVGTGEASASSKAVVPALSVSSPSTVLIATPSNAEVALSWTAPAATGGAALIGYNLYEGTTAGGESYSSPVNGAVLIVGTSSTVNGLTNGHTYYFTVKAVNAVGSSLASNEAWAIPGATVADAPQSVNAVAGNEGNVVVTWNAPLKSGGSSITGYAVTPYIGIIAQTARIFDSTVTAETVADLQAGTSYSFTVEAINASGTGAQSAPSGVVSLPLAYTRLTLSLSAATITYGHEQAETFSVTVSPTYSGPVPAGSVLVKKSTTTLCVIKLSAAKGSCSLTRADLPARTFSVYATYARNTSFVGSTSAKQRLTVARATSKTAIRLSVAKVTYGHEQLERISVTVSPEYPGAMPTGPVTITGLACHITLSSGKGSCTLSSKRFRVSSHFFVATYWGNAHYSGSASTGHILTVR